MATTSRKPSRRPVPAPVVYDEAQRHREGSWPRGTDPRQAFVPGGLFLAWAAQRGLTSSKLSEALVRAVEARRLSGPELYEQLGGVLREELFNDEGRRFATRYYATGTYLQDFKEVLASGLASAYQVTPSRRNFVLLAARLDERLSAFRGTRSRLPVKPAGSELDARLRRLAAKAKKGEVEVEHLLRFAELGDPAAIAALLEMKQRHGWAQQARSSGARARRVPLGRWVDYVCAFLEGGSARLVELALDPEELRRDRACGSRPGDFALGVLKTVKHPDSVRAVLTIARGAMAAGTRALLVGCADAFGHLLVFKPSVEIDDESERDVRGLLHGLLEGRLSTPELATVYSALRGVGDESSLALVERRPAPAPWDELQLVVVKAIKQRIRSRGG